jgi:hypothetical protein
MTIPVCESSTHSIRNVFPLLVSKVPGWLDLPESARTRTVLPHHLEVFTREGLPEQTNCPPS